MTSDDKRIGWLTIGLIFVPVAVFLLAAYGARLSGDGASGMAGWVEAVGTTLGVVAAAIAARFAWQAYQLELARDRDRQAEINRSQASQIAAWVETRTKLRERGIIGEPPMDAVWVREWGIQVQNASTLPVYDVVARVEVVTVDHLGAVGREHLGRFEIGLVPPSLEPKFWRLSRSLEEAKDQRHEALLDGQLVAVDYEVALNFRDASNRRWERGFDGRLLP